ncbi:MAG: 3-isopropylmalate dehydratase small subunit [Deltaproteobacteria bacterium]|nr:MAG: 3-isopropylmalate dehydratase small subunit [Deltaproteobacteria bacterium]
MEIKGRVWKFGDDVDTDVIIPARYLNTSDPEELAKHCMEDLDPEFASKVKPGDIIVAGKNFGCGSSREHAPIAIKGAGVAAVIARSFARIFYRNSFNTGLLILEAPEAVDRIEEGDELVIDVAKGEIRNVTKGETYTVKPIPPFMRELIEAGGLMPYTLKRVREKS